MKRNKFSLSNTKLLSCMMGRLVPCGLTEVLPGDSIQQSTSVLIRVTPLLAPVMHKVDVRVHHFFVPHRLTWEHFEDFITGGPDGMDASVFPTITLSYAAGPPATGSGVVGGLADYLGCPPGVNGLVVSALPFRAYALVFNEWWRDQDLQNPVALSTESGADVTTSTALLRCGWEKDYFTSARPWTQKGPEVSIPLQGNAPISGLGTAAGNSGTAQNGVKDSIASGQNWAAGFNSGTQPLIARAAGSGTGSLLDVYADLSNVTAANINDLRLAFALQRYEEARARYGSRYTEYLAYLGVRSSDARLQRPEYLGGGSNTIQFSEVLQTADNVVEGEVEETTGQLRGHGIGAMRSNRYRRFFEEHGYVISLLSVRPRTMYVQGLARHWNRRTKEDFWQRELEHIGQQEVLNKELYAAHSSPNGTFGYQDRYDEYRRTENTIAGEFRTTLLDYWHMARIFSAEPVLNASFIECDPTLRVFAEQTQDSLWVKVMHSIQARRQLSKTGTSFIF